MRSYAGVRRYSGACLRSEECRFAENDPDRGGARTGARIYLAWIRTLGCAVCSRVSGGATVIEAAHTNVLGPRGLGQKTSDFSAIPLCAAHHRENLDSYHALGEQGFSHRHGIDLEEIVHRLQGRFRQQGAFASRIVQPVEVG